MQANPIFTNVDVRTVFDSYPEKLQKKLLALRQLIISTAASTAGVGPLTETLKWGEPAYITPSKSGSTVRIGCAKDQATYAIYFNCNTTLVDTYRSMFPHTFKFEGDRAMVFALNDTLPAQELAFCVSMALTYHLKKPKKKSPHAPR